MVEVLHNMETKDESCRTLLFNKEHEELRKQGEKWLRETSDSCMLVATLITTISFLAGFSALGGNEHRMGRPILIDSFWFKTFATSNAITLIFSASSVLFFLSIITSPFAMNDFLISLPFKLLLGLSSLLTSILGMIVGSFAAFFGIFKQRNLQFRYPVVVAAVSCITVLFFAFRHLSLFYRVFCATLMSFLQSRQNRFLPDY